MKLRLCPTCEEPLRCIIGDFWLCEDCERDQEVGSLACEGRDDSEERLTEWSVDVTTEDINWYDSIDRSDLYKR